MLCIHRAERADALVAALAEVLAAPAGDPFEAELVAVPTRGMERWLTQQLSARLGAGPGLGDGICAGIGFPFPARVVNGALATATGIDPEEDPWPPERSVWPLLRVVERCRDKPWLLPLVEHIGGQDEGSDLRADRRFPAVRRLADLFDRYGVHRPGMVRAWAAGQNLDATGQRLPDDAAWQAELWRELREEIGEPSPPERLLEACQRLSAEPELAELPPRLSLFGLTRLPRSFLDVLEAVAAHRDVHLFLLHPSPALWGRVNEALRGLDAPPLRRDEDETSRLVLNRLLASWGQDSRELQLVVSRAPQLLDRHHPVDLDGDTLLTRIQRNVIQDQAPPGRPPVGESDERAELDPDDRSIQVHACHGRLRQVEVLREALLHLMEGDPSLEPRDIIVMCPDIETYAPLIQATFAAAEEDDDRDEDDAGPTGDLRVRLADRSLTDTNPLLGVLSALLELPRTRMSASDVLDLADREPVRRRFALADDDLARIRDWVEESGIRWGLDAPHREPFRLEKVADGTWQAGLDRLLAGVSMADEGTLYGGILPLDDVPSAEIELAGRLAEFVQRLSGAIDALASRQPASGWRAAIGEAIEALTWTPDRLAWQRGELNRVLDELLGEATAAPELSLGEVRALLGHRLAGRPTRANFRTGHLTVCTLVPMRSVPHRVVCLLGLDDGSFPRRSPRNGDDLTVADTQVGDRDPRVEDRQMLLDALLAARERLIVTYTGADERTGARRPPAVPLGELLDEIDATVRVPDGMASERLLRIHPLQTFDPRNFTTASGPWSFDRVALAGAHALSAPRQAAPAFLTDPLEGPVRRVIELDSLVAFVQHPVRTFLRSRLGLYLSEEDEGPRDSLPIELDGLENYGVGERLLEGVLAGRELEQCIRAERARGTLPPGDLAEPALQKIRPLVEKLARRVAEVAPHGPAQTLEVNLELPSSRLRLAGAVSGVRGAVILQASYARSKPSHRIAAWVRLLALSAAHPEQPWTAASVGRGAWGNTAAVARVRALYDSPAQRRETALDLLERLVSLYQLGMREPLPVGCVSAEAYATALLAGRDPLEAAEKSWNSGFYPGENATREHQLVYGGLAPFGEIADQLPREGEEGSEWTEEATRFGRLARVLWDELLAREETDSG